MTLHRHTARFTARVPAGLLQALLLRLGLVLGLALLASQVSAQPANREFSETIDWYYAAAFGTGVYQFDERSVLVVRAPLSHTPADTATLPGVRGDTLPRRRWIAPVTVGLYSYDVTELSSNFNEQLGTVSVLPGYEQSWQLSPEWLVSGQAQAGYGTEWQGDNHAWLYNLGVTSWWHIPPTQGETDLVVANRLRYAGYEDSAGQSNIITQLATSVNLFTPINRSLDGHALELGVHMTYYSYFNELDFITTAVDEVTLGGEMEMALTLGSQQPWTVLGLEIKRVGLGIRYGEELSAVRLLVGLPF